MIVLLNNDVEVIDSNWLREMVSLGLREDTGCVGAKLYYPNGHIQHAGVIIGLGGVAAHGHWMFSNDDHGYYGRLKVRQNYSAVTAACLLVRKNIFTAVGGLNEEELSVAFNDIDFSLKVRKAGYKNVWTPFAKLIHHESATRGYEDTPEKKARYKAESEFMRKSWNIDSFCDPAYNPNLTLDHSDFSFGPAKWKL
jgi:GT2 family glycosyltransferase